MTLSLDNNTLRFEFSPESGLWSVQSSLHGGSTIENLLTGLSLGPRESAAFSPGQITGVERVVLNTAGRVSDGIRVSAAIFKGRIEAEAEYCLVEDGLLWRLKARNISPEPLKLDQLIFLQSNHHKGTVHSRSVHGPSKGSRRNLLTSPDQLRVFVNGWQSWSPGGSFGSEDTMPGTSFGPFLNPMHCMSGKPMPKERGRFISDMFGVIGLAGGPAFLLGYVSQQQAFGQLEMSLQGEQAHLCLREDADDLVLDEGQSFISDWACLLPLDMGEDDPCAGYYSLLNDRNNARSAGPVPVGWSSWYHYFQNITEQDVLENLDWISSRRVSLPLDLVQIDDGFQSDIGDWMTFSDGFPDGPGPAAREIRSRGLRPGIWLAPFIVRRSSGLYRSHSEWLIRNNRRAPVNAGFVWNSFGAGLDISHPGVQDYAAQLTRTAVEEWGFDYLKLDFLYAGVLKGRRYNVHQTRAQAMHQAFQRIRDAVGQNVSLLGCGYPLGAGIGVFDIFRIGADVAPVWTPKFFGVQFPFRRERAFPSARNSILSILSRMPMHRTLWVNDPDCILLREDESSLSEVESNTLAVVAGMSAGAMIVSDPLERLSSDRSAFLSFLLPPLDEPAKVLDWFTYTVPEKLVLPMHGPTGDWLLAALINWEDYPVNREVQLSEYGVHGDFPVYVFDYWRRRALKLDPAVRMPVPIDAHGTALFAIRRADRKPAWIGDTLHISQGGLVKEWHVEEGELTAVLESGHARSGSVWLDLPGEAIQAVYGGVELIPEREPGGFIRLNLSIDTKQTLSVRWTQA